METDDLISQLNDRYVLLADACSKFKNACYEYFYDNYDLEELDEKTQNHLEDILYNCQDELGNANECIDEMLHIIDIDYQLKNSW